MTLHILQNDYNCSGKELGNSSCLTSASAKCRCVTSSSWVEINWKIFLENSQRKQDVCLWF